MTPERFQKIKKVLNKRQPDLTVIMENVHKPHNIAAILRSCDAVGIGKVYGISNSEQRVGVNLKSASGANHWVNLEVKSTMNKCIHQLKAKGFSIYCANRSKNSVDYRKIDYTKSTAIVLGAELDGVSENMINNTDGEIKIPMQGMVESLNVSVANAIILFEAQRQRNKAGNYNSKRLDDSIYQRLLFEFSYPEVASILNKNQASYPDLDDEGQIIK